MAKKAKRKLTPFEQSFATARANKLSTFAYKGKSYSTKRADTAAKTPRAGVQKTRSTSSVSLPNTAPVPTASPNRGKLANPPPPGIRFAANVPTPTRRPPNEPAADLAKRGAAIREQTALRRPKSATAGVTTGVPRPAGAGAGDIYRAQEIARRKPQQADPAIVKKFTKSTTPTATRVSTATSVLPVGIRDAVNTTAARTRQTVQPLVPNKATRVRTTEVVRGVEQPGVATAKTGRLKNTNMARTGDRLGSQAPVAAVNPFEPRKVKTTRIKDKTKTPVRARFGY